MDMAAKNMLCYGQVEPLPEQIRLRAGPLAVIYTAGDLRSITLGEQEVLQRVYAAVRDDSWATIPMTLSNLRIEQTEDTFHIGYDARHLQHDIDFVWHATISGTTDGTITFRMDGTAQSTFQRNRIGLCVLHSSRRWAGMACQIEHTDGTIEDGSFPDSIAPHQPFTDIRALIHTVGPGTRAEVRFLGDVFEMEDQRNWTDASYKTYSTPLSRPFPVMIEAATIVQQTVTLTITGVARAVDPPRTSAACTLVVGDALSQTLPQIGLGSVAYRAVPNAIDRARLKPLQLAHLRVDLHLANPDWMPTLKQAHAEAQALALPLELALFLSDAGAELIKLRRALADLMPPVKRWMIFHEHDGLSHEGLMQIVRAHLLADDGGAMIGGGTDGNFAELNRNRPAPGALDFVSYSLNPQMHAFDHGSLVENLEGQPATVESARQFSYGLPLIISCVTLRRGGRPLSTAAHDGEDQSRSPGTDPRQRSLFGAAWTLGSLKYLAESGVTSMTYYETIGAGGLMDGGVVFPMYHVFQALGAWRDGALVATTASEPARFVGLGVRLGAQTMVCIANLTAKQITIVVSGLGTPVRVKVLDETTVEDAMQAPEIFETQPYATAVTVDGRLPVLLLPFAVVWLVSNDAPNSR